jgi:DNA-directed RNA polymerase subunit RPC12/RpoP
MYTCPECGEIFDTDNIEIFEVYDVDEDMPYGQVRCPMCGGFKLLY